MDEKLAAYVEEVALFWEGFGMPRIAGRIIGLLLVCDPPHRSAAELEEELGVSKSSVSTMIRLLLASGTLERVALPGDRATYYALAPDSLERKFEGRLASMVGFEALAERGLTLLAGEPCERLERLRLVHAMYGFMAREVPLLLEKWRQERARLIGGDP